MTVKIAMCQIFALDGDRSGNFARIDHAMGEAKEMGADIACFPETSILGWVNPAAHERAFAIPGPDTDRLGELARKHGIYVCIGLAEKEGDRLYDSVVLMDENGHILLKHRKINILTHLMDPPYTPGQGVQAVDTKWGRIGLMICADSFIASISAEMKALEPDILLIPYGWAAPENDWPGHGENLKSVVQGAAKATGAYVIGTDLVGEISSGPWRGMVYGGQSVAVRPDGEVIAVARDRDREVRLVRVANGKSVRSARADAGP